MSVKGTKHRKRSHMSVNVGGPTESVKNRASLTDNATTRSTWVVLGVLVGAIGAVFFIANGGNHSTRTGSCGG